MTDILTTDDIPIVTMGRNELSGHCLKYETEGVTQARYSKNGAIRVMTGARTGRSQDARFFIKGSKYDEFINWNNKLNQGFDPNVFDQVWQDALLHAKNAQNPMFFSELYAIANTNHARPLKVYTHYAWHMLFALNMFIELQKRMNLNYAEEWTILNDPSFLLDEKYHEKYGVKEGRGIFIDFTNKRILLAGMHYGGEMKKALFTAMNVVLPLEGYLTMHCSANVSAIGETTIYFGLSGTGKTTLSADPEKSLIGDDEHVWTPEGICNIEGGCYAKGIGVSPATEPDIYNAIFNGAIIENADLVKDNEPILHHPRIENVRISYDLSHIENRMPGSRDGHPVNIVFLTKDAYGIMPPISVLSKEQALYHYANAYTSEGAGTVMGQKKGKVKHNFSFGYGAAFYPLHYEIYIDLFKKNLDTYEPKVWLVNTGYFGGSEGEGGHRYPLQLTRNLLNAALSGELDQVPTKHLIELNLNIPTHVDGIEDELLDPENAWENKEAYHALREKLIGFYRENHNEKFSDLPEEIRAAGPRL
ncbi:MAG: phosphoenolpyruvate carboxykinase (ATP) [Candidatus Paceibacterota bacterium]|jgi:phosphoenolpyruvate carboxykinase (ATP)|nr:phosphoenolpyruvate carboxykinase (ATP) [Candidatus Paceibacterota bacterium]